MYFQDFIDEALRIEAEIKDFSINDDSKIFKNYFRLIKEFDTPLFCNYSDEYQKFINESIFNI